MTFLRGDVALHWLFNAFVCDNTGHRQQTKRSTELSGWDIGYLEVRVVRKGAYRYPYLLKNIEHLPNCPEATRHFGKRHLTEMDDIKRDIVTQQASNHKLRMEIKDRLLETVQEKKHWKGSKMP